MTFYNKVGNHPGLARNPGSGHEPSVSPVNRMGQFHSGRPFSRYSITTKELRRVLKQARERHPDEDFDVRGAFLPGMVGDEAWRAHASAFSFVLRRRVAPGGGGDALLCEAAPAAREGDGDGAPGEEVAGACPPWVESSLFAGESSHPLAWLARKLILQQPYPIVPGEEGAHRAVMCFGP